MYICALHNDCVQFSINNSGFFLFISSIFFFVRGKNTRFECRHSRSTGYVIKLKQSRSISMSRYRCHVFIFNKKQILKKTLKTNLGLIYVSTQTAKQKKINSSPVPLTEAILLHDILLYFLSCGTFQGFHCLFISRLIFFSSL